MPKLLLATRNAHKVGELRRLLDPLAKVDVLSAADFPDVSDPAETGETFLDNAVQKACHYCRATGLAALADDSGLVVDALDGRPGVYSSRYGSSDADRIARLLGEMARIPDVSRTARFVCAMVFALPSGEMRSTEGRLEGSIARTAAGENGFGYDPIFHVDELGCTLAQVPGDTKNRISHRGRALALMLDVLREYYDQHADH